jgi:nucleoside-diphosphate-sugar epimerase
VRGFEARGARVQAIVRTLQVRSPAGALASNEALADPGSLRGADVLVHAAAVPVRHRADAAGARSANLDLLERAMRAAASAGIRRFVLVGSVAVYGYSPRLPITEDHPYAPRTPQAAIKVELEVRARRAARELGLELCIVRPAPTYGPGDHGMLETMAALIRAGTYRVVGPGDNVLHHVHVDDVVEGVWLAGAHAEAAGDHFILAGPETITLAALSERVAAVVGRPLPRRHVPSGLARALATVADVAANRGLAFTSREPPISHAVLDEMTLPVCFDVTKAQRHLGFAPRVGYAEGVTRTLRGDWPALARAGAGS